MYRKIVWCYIIVLTLLDIPLNTKLSAQGKSHGNGVSVHESLVEGYTLQDWSKESSDADGAGGSGIGRGRPIPAGVLQLSPPRLAFGRAALAAPHVLSVTITNTANETIHLASVAGTTPDFHSSFFDSKTLAPQANTSFSVVYLGRREGPVSAYLYIHTSKGIYKYPVSAVGVASPYRVWPLVGVRVPHNATLEPRLTLYNPTDTTIQVSEVYSSGSWVGLALPAGSVRAAWAVPPHAARDLVALQLRPPAGAASLTAYVRVRADLPGPPLVVAVEASAAPPGEYLSAPHLRLAVRGSRDPAERFWLEAGNSGEAAVAVAGGVEGAACAALDDAEAGAPPPPAHHNGRSPAPGADVAVLLQDLPPRAPPTRAAALTLDFARLWAGAGAEGGAAGGARCGGWARVGRAALPYSLTLLPGTLDLQPPHLHFVTGSERAAPEPRELRAHNQFPVPVRVAAVLVPDEVKQHFEVETATPAVLAAGGAARLARLRLRPGTAARELSADLTVLTNVTEYRVPLLVYSPDFHIEWEWPAEAWSAERLELGVVALGASLEVAARVAGGGAARASAALAGGAAALRLQPGGAALRVTAPRAPGAARGWLELRSPHAAARVALSLTAAAGHVALAPADLPPAAPYVWAAAPLVAESSMARAMRVLNVTQPPDRLDPALSVTVEEGSEVRAGRVVVAQLQYAPEEHCRPRCYTGLDLATPEGAAWVSRGRGGAGPAALAEDGAAARERASRRPVRPWEASVRLETNGVRRAAGAVRVPAAWPRLVARAPPPPRAAVAASAPLRLTVANPSSSHALLVQLVLHPRAVPLAESEEPECEGCVWCADSFVLSEWRATRGSAAPWAAGPEPEAEPEAAPGPGEYLLLSPRAELEVTVSFTPRDAAHLATYLYIRNNLTIVERVPVTGVGAHPTFELGGRRPNSSAALVVDVGECGAGGGAGVGGRTLALRNTGAVPLRLRAWRVAGVPCGARGFRLQPCAALQLQPNESRSLHLAFAADWTRARVLAPLTVRVGARQASFALAGAVPARTLARCAPAARRPPFEPPLRALGVALALLALAGAAALAAADAERALRRHRAARPAPPARAPLDLRALARPAPPAPPPPAPRRRRTPRRRAGLPLDPAAERRAFERWRADVERRAVGDVTPALHDGSSPSEEEGEDPPPPSEPSSPHSDTSESSPDCSPPPRDSYSMSSRLNDPGEEEEEDEEDEEEEEGGSTVSETSSGGDERSEGDEGTADLASAPPPAAATPPPRSSPLRPHLAACLDPLCTHHDGAARRSARPPAPRAALRPAPRRPRRRDRPASPPRAQPRAEPRAGAPPVRWGASWSSVVSRGPDAAHTPPPAPRPAPAPPAPRAATPPPGADGAPPPPLAPIGSDVRRRHGSHSLFFYSGETAAATRWPPNEERPAEARWGAGEGPAAAWGWGSGAGAVRPPPGFPLPRVYDPFHSLASIWTPAALDWRADHPATPPLDDKFDPTVPPPSAPAPAAAPAERPPNN